MIAVAVRALAAVGVKVRLRTQLAPAASVAPLMQVVPEASAKSPALAPPSTAAAILRGAAPVLGRVTVCTGLGVLTRWVPKARLAGAKVTAGAMPVPARDIDCGFFFNESVTAEISALSLPDALPILRLRTQLAPAASVAPLMQVVPEASAKSPALAPPSTAVAMLRGAVPLLVRVTVCTGLGVLTR